MTSDAVDTFEEGAQPESWQFSAEILIASAHLLWIEIEKREARPSEASASEQEKSDLRPFSLHGFSALLLAGYAIENLLKAIRLKQRIRTGPAPITGGKLNKYFMTHRLTELAKNAGISLTTDDVALLALLERSVTWSAKYPMPKSAEAGTITRIASSDDQVNMERLYELLDRFYHAIP